jgi:N-acetylneuraminic acid mutarotase
MVENGQAGSSGMAGSAGSSQDAGQPDSKPKEAYWANLNGNPPEARDIHSAVWTGTQMIVWGGRQWNESTLKYSYLNSGGIYDLGKDDWLFMNNSQAPAARVLNSAIWTGDKMVIWSGINNSGALGDGAAYDPTVNEWQTISTQNSPAPKYFHATVWTGTHMIVTGGLTSDYKPTRSGGIYNPVTDTWGPMAEAPEACSELAAIWTGSLMLTFGGYSDESKTYCGNYTYDPVTDKWSAMPNSNAPSARAWPIAIWTGEEMITWGGYLKTDPLKALAEGGIYNPVDDAWESMNTLGSPMARFNQTAVWTGNRMIVWGGSDLGDYETDSGGEYDPAAHKWTKTGDTAPPNRIFHTALWINPGMIVWGGFTGIRDTASGGIYYPGD